MKNAFKFSLVFLCVVLCFSILPVISPIVLAVDDPIAFGTCGENLTWELDSDGILTISGTGEMNDDWNEAPWKYYQDSEISEYIYTVEVMSGVTSIGHDAFSNCDNLKSVTIPQSVTYIGNGAFEACDSLEEIHLPSNLTIIGDHVFMDCVRLATVELPNNLRTIEGFAFYGCIALESVSIPYGVRSIENDAFSSSGLKSIAIPDSVRELGYDAFADCQNIKTAKLSNNLKKILLSRHFLGVQR